MDEANYKTNNCCNSLRVWSSSSIARRRMDSCFATTDGQPLQAPNITATILHSLAAAFNHPLWGVTNSHPASVIPLVIVLPPTFVIDLWAADWSSALLLVDFGPMLDDTYWGGQCGSCCYHFGVFNKTSCCRNFSFFQWIAPLSLKDLIIPDWHVQFGPKAFLLLLSFVLAIIQCEVTTGISLQKFSCGCLRMSPMQFHTSAFCNCRPLSFWSGLPITIPIVPGAVRVPRPVALPSPLTTWWAPLLVRWFSPSEGGQCGSCCYHFGVFNETSCCRNFSFFQWIAPLSLKDLIIPDWHVQFGPKAFLLLLSFVLAIIQCEVTTGISLQKFSCGCLRMSPMQFHTSAFCNCRPLSFWSGLPITIPIVPGAVRVPRPVALPSPLTTWWAPLLVRWFSPSEGGQCGSCCYHFGVFNETSCCRNFSFFQWIAPLSLKDLIIPDWHAQFGPKAFLLLLSFVLAIIQREVTTGISLQKFSCGCLRMSPMQFHTSAFCNCRPLSFWSGLPITIPIVPGAVRVPRPVALPSPLTTWWAPLLVRWFSPSEGRQCGSCCYHFGVFNETSCCRNFSFFQWIAPLSLKNLIIPDWHVQFGPKAFLPLLSFVLAICRREEPTGISLQKFTHRTLGMSPMQFDTNGHDKQTPEEPWNCWKMEAKRTNNSCLIFREFYMTQSSSS